MINFANPPKAVVVDGIVTNHEQLKRYWAEHNEMQAIIQRGTFRDLRNKREMEEAEETKTPVQLTPSDWDLIRQLQSEVRGWRKKHAEMMASMDTLTKQKDAENDPF